MDVTRLDAPANGKCFNKPLANCADAIKPSDNPKRLGVLAGDTAGFPNGRRLTDDVIDIELRVVAGVLVPGFNVEPNNQLGDGVNRPFKRIGDTFPYQATPYSAFLSVPARAVSEEDRDN